MPVLGRHCAEIMESRHPDVIEMDAASNTGVDNIREIIESARYRPLLARTKVFIIDEVHMLSKGAFNALLKTLEEPPGHVKFIFATTEVRQVPVTVLSRCQRFDLRRVTADRLAQHLKAIVAHEGATATDEALMMIARAAEGSVRDALSILDQAIATSSALRSRRKVPTAPLPPPPSGPCSASPTAGAFSIFCLISSPATPRLRCRGCRAFSTTVPSRARC